MNWKTPKGGQQMAKLYDSENGVIVSSFQMLSKTNLNQTGLQNLAFDKIIDVETLLDEKEHLEFFIYRLNLFEVDNLKEFIETNKSNLEQLHALDEGDIISFQRNLYTHHAILTGYFTFNYDIIRIIY